MVVTDANSVQPRVDMGRHGTGGSDGDLELSEAGDAKHTFNFSCLLPTDEDRVR